MAIVRYKDLSPEQLAALIKISGKNTGMIFKVTKDGIVLTSKSKGTLHVSKNAEQAFSDFFELEKAVKSLKKDLKKTKQKKE